MWGQVSHSSQFSLYKWYVSFSDSFRMKTRVSAALLLVGSCCFVGILFLNFFPNISASSNHSIYATSWQLPSHDILTEAFLWVPTQACILPAVHIIVVPGYFFRKTWFMYLCVYVCEYAWPFVCMWRQGGVGLSSLIMLPTFAKVSHWTWSSSLHLDW